MTPQERQTWVRRMGARHDWWARRQEPAVEPGWEVVDAHFHLWAARTLPDPADGSLSLHTSPYLLDDFLRDTGGGHAVAAAVYIECGSGYDADAPAHLRAAGESAFAARMAAQAAARAGATAIGAVVGHADLRDPRLDALLDAHAHHGRELFKGVRQSGARLDDPSARLLAGAAPAGLYADPDFRRGLARLGARGLTFDAFQFHFQVAEVDALAAAIPDTTIVINHLGTPVGFGGRASRDALFATWATGIEKLARLPNVVMKLGGLASMVTGYDGGTREAPPSSAQFVDERGAYFRHAIACFGPDRCMFESNFPVDSVSISYGILWNAYKLIAAAYDDDARDSLLATTARRVYRMA